VSDTVRVAVDPQATDTGTFERFVATGVHEGGRTALMNASWRKPHPHNILAFMGAVEQP
jgi:hypothetical protein